MGDDTSEDDPDKQTAYERYMGLFPKAYYIKLSAWVDEFERRPQCTTMPSNGGNLS